MLGEKADACVRRRGDRLCSRGNHQLRHEGDQSSGEEHADNCQHNSLRFALAGTAVKELLSIINCLSSSLLLHYPFLKSIFNNFRTVNKQSHFKREKTVHNLSPFPGKILTST